MLTTTSNSGTNSNSLQKWISPQHFTCAASYVPGICPFSSGKGLPLENSMSFAGIQVSGTGLKSSSTFQTNSRHINVTVFGKLLVNFTL